MKMFQLCNTLSIHKFQCHIFFPSQDIKQNVLLSSYLDQCLQTIAIHILTNSLKSKGNQTMKLGQLIECNM